MRWTLLFTFFCLPLTATFAAPLRSASPYSSEKKETVTQKETAAEGFRKTVENIRHELGNHELEIRVFEEKLQSLDSIIESLRDQLSESSKQQKEFTKNSSTSLDTKISALEILSKNLVADIKQFKTYSTETTEILTQYKLKIGELEKIVIQQGQSINHLQTAMRTLTEALQDKDCPSANILNTSALPGSTSGSTYRVQTGDSLEKIAKTNHTTIQAIKQLNGLTNDRITAGKVLQIPEK